MAHVVFWILDNAIGYQDYLIIPVLTNDLLFYVVVMSKNNELMRLGIVVEHITWG